MLQVIYHAERENRKGRRYFGKYYLDPGLNSVPEDFETYLKETAKTDKFVEYLLEDRVIVFLHDRPAEVEAAKPTKKLSKKETIPVIDE